VRLTLYRKRYYATWTDGGQTKRIALRTSDLSEAERQLADLKRKPLGKTIGDCATAYLADKQITAASFKNMKFAWDTAAPFFAHLRPGHVTRDLCREYAAKRRSEGVQDGTIIKELSTVRSAINWAIKHNEAVFELPSQPPPKDRWLTEAEARALVAACHTHHIKLFTVLALATAARSNALLDLTWDRVNFERGFIELDLPGRRRKKRATVPINDMARQMLLEAHAGRLSPYVVEWGGDRVRSIKKGFGAAAKAAGLKDVTPHTLRHTAATWMTMKGVPMGVIAQYLGHTNSRITERVYAKYAPDFLQAAAQAVSLNLSRTGPA
jgi:integrase